MKKSLLFALALCASAAGAKDIGGIANPGFENGREMWIFETGNLRVVDDVSRTGKRSAFIEVKNAMTDGLYIKRHVPITGGGSYRAECYVKTEDVRKDACRQGSVGAGLIVEWLDANKKWIGTGEYACGLWGTADWRKVECKRLRAPIQARYAFVFLALRGAGKAWFDDVALSRADSAVEMISPADGSELECNTPLFAWKESAGARSYSIVVSRTKDFSREVRTYPAGGLMSYRLLDRLAPGTWYWKAIAPGREDAAPWRFVQLADKERDTLPPEVMTVGARVHSPSEKFEVTVRDDSFDGVKAVFEGQCAVPGKDAGAGLRKFVFAPPADGWAKGLTVGEMVTRDKHGNSAKRKFYLLNAPRPGNYVQLDREGFYTVAGKRFFPLSIYEVVPQYLKEVRAAGFDNVHLYRWEGAASDSECRKYLDECFAADGLRAFVGFNRGRSGNGLMQGNYDMVAARVGALADHQGLFCWYLYDEPELLDQFISPARLMSYKELINALDPYHPVVMSTWNNAMVGIRDYRPAWDVHWTQAYGNPDGMLKIIESQREHLGEKSPMTLILACNDSALAEIRRRGETPDPDKFARDYDLFRACAYLGIAMDFNGLSWWWYGKDRKDFYSAAQSPKAWRDFTKVIAEIKALRPLISSNGKVATGKAMVGESAILWWTKVYRAKRYLIAVSASEKPVDAVFSVPGFGRLRKSFGRYGVWCHSIECKDREVRYLSNAGDDSNDGMTPESAWRTIGKLNRDLPAGATARLRAGDVFYGTVEVMGGVDKDFRTFITSFGDGPKPVIAGTKNLRCDPAIWKTNAERYNYWFTDLADRSNFSGIDSDDANPGFLIVDGEIKAWRHFCRHDINRQWDFAGEDGKLYVYSTNNPALLAKDLKVAVNSHGMLLDSHTFVSNVTFRSLGGHGICAGWEKTAKTDIHIRDCRFENIGGSELLSFKGMRVRYGNGVEFGSNCFDCTVEGCFFTGIYDVAFTMQGVPSVTGWNDIHMRSCHIENSSQAFEIWCQRAKPGMGFSRCSFTGNRVMNVGGGWGARTRPNRIVATPLLVYKMETDTVDVTVSGNSFEGMPNGLMFVLNGKESLSPGYRILDNIVK